MCIYAWGSSRLIIFAWGHTRLGVFAVGSFAMEFMTVKMQVVGKFVWMSDGGFQGGLPPDIKNITYNHCTVLCTFVVSKIAANRHCRENV